LLARGGGDGEGVSSKPKAGLPYGYWYRVVTLRGRSDRKNRGVRKKEKKRMKGTQTLLQKKEKKGEPSYAKRNKQNGKTKG